MKFIFSILLILLGLEVSAVDYCSIKGQVHENATKKVDLFKTVEGKPVLCSSSVVAADGSYGFLFKPESSGFYAIGDLNNNYLIYVESGDEVNIDLYKDKAQLTGKNTIKNQTLYLWKDYAAEVSFKSLNYYKSCSIFEDFFPAYEKFLTGFSKIRRQLKSGDAAFDTELQILVEYEKDYFATLFLQTPRLKHPEPSQIADFYKDIVSDKKYTDETVLSHPWGISMLASYALFAANQSGKKFANIDERTDECLNYINNSRLKGEFILNSHLVYIKNYPHYAYCVERYGKYITTASQKERADKLGSKLFVAKDGNLAADFTYPDINGKEVSLSDFRGKVVLLDVWATWCGPCKAQIPHLIKLEKEMKDKGLVVIGVSVNEAKDKQKWMDFVKKEGLGGVQVFANGWSKITKDYKIKCIPRFMVFDKKGHIVSMNAPRPSDPQLKALLEAELNK